jgi:uncharacterized protein YjbJ (UPF0337 family)
MTESTGSPYQGTQPTSDASTRDVAKDEARGVAQDAAQAGKQTVGTAKEQAGEVAGEAATQAKALLDQAREQITSQGSSSKERAATGLRTLAEDLTGMVEGTGSQQQGLAADLAREASHRVQTVADWLESRDPADVLEDVRRFARRRPGVFLLSAAAVGFLGGRVTRSIAAEAKDSSDSSNASGYQGGYTNPAPVGGLSAAGSHEPGYAGTAGVPATAAGTATGGTATAGTATGYTESAPGTPGYGIPPTGDTRGDATAEFSPNAPDTGLGEASTDQMPSEFGARGTNASGNRTEGTN